MTSRPPTIERISIELTNRCTKACAFCYNRSHPGGETRWQQEELVALIGDCARRGTRAVSLGGGEPLEFEGLFELLERTRGVLFRSLTTNGLALAGANVTRLLRAAPDKVHVCIHFPEDVDEVARVARQALALSALGLRSGVNLLVSR
jgi:MoaA/NifB/PqqE/SkfB family radical SAM enzyme